MSIPIMADSDSLSMHKPGCTFCDILKKQTDFVYEDDDFVAFQDIRPASSCHYLIVTKTHISHCNIKELDLPDVHKFYAAGRKVLDSVASITKEDDSVLMGFHLPPFYSIDHRHMHVIAPKSEMGYVSRIIFWPNDIWFTSVKSVIGKLEKQICKKDVPLYDKEE